MTEQKSFIKKREVKGYSIKDLVFLGIMNAVLIILFWGTMLALHLFPPLYCYMDSVISFLLAPVFLLMLLRVPKFGVLTIHGTILGSIFLVMGWWPGLLGGIIGGCIADIIALPLGGYRRKLAIWFSYPIFTTTKAFFFYAPLYLFTRTKIHQLALQQYPQESIDTYTAAVAVSVLVVNLIASLAGLFIGNKILNRHFKRAGIV